MEILIWLLKVNVAIILFYGLYRLFFQQDTFFKLKRFILLCSLSFAFVYPFLNVTDSFVRDSLDANKVTIIELPAILIHPEVKEPVNQIFFTDILLYVWVAGLVVGCIFLITQLISIGKYYKNPLAELSQSMFNSSNWFVV